MKSYNKILDPTVPDRDEFVAGGKHAGLEDDLDDIVKGLSGSAEKQRGQLHDNTLGVAKKHDLPFGTVHSMLMTRHPKLRQNEDLTPTPFAPKALTLTEIAEKKREMDEAEKKREREKTQKQVSGVDQGHENRMARIKAMQDRDPGLTFASCWEETETEELPLVTVKKPVVVQPRPQVVTPRPATPTPQVVWGNDFPNGGPYLVHGIDIGLVCPIFPEE